MERDLGAHVVGVEGAGALGPVEQPLGGRVGVAAGAVEVKVAAQIPGLLKEVRVQPGSRVWYYLYAAGEPPAVKRFEAERVPFAMILSPEEITRHWAAGIKTGSASSSQGRLLF